MKVFKVHITFRRILAKKILNICNQPLKPGYADTITLQKMCDPVWKKEKFIQMEALSHAHQLRN